MSLILRSMAFNRASEITTVGGNLAGQFLQGVVRSYALHPDNVWIRHLDITSEVAILKTPRIDCRLIREFISDNWPNYADRFCVCEIHFEDRIHILVSITNHM